jgi:hypothetical protein
MMKIPDFDELLLPREQWGIPALQELITADYPSAEAWAMALYRAGAHHGYERGYNNARQLWPEPIIDRRPNEKDADENGSVQELLGAGWILVSWECSRGRSYPWLHTPRWKPKQPTLQKQALRILHENGTTMDGRMELEPDEITLIRRALEQAGEA